MRGFRFVEGLGGRMRMIEWGYLWGGGFVVLWHVVLFWVYLVFVVLVEFWVWTEWNGMTWNEDYGGGRYDRMGMMQR